MSPFLHHFGRQSEPTLLMRAYLTTLLITAVDVATGAELSLLIFYVFPIIAVSWFVGRRHGIGIAITATVATALHDLLQTDSSFILAGNNLFYYWRFLQIGGVFLTISLISAALRASEREKRTIEHGLAREVQSFLLPQTARSTGGLTCFGMCKPSDHLTGDFFDLIPLGRGRLAILVGDICGKGISAALLMAYTQGLLRSHVPFAEISLGNLMNNINRSLHRVTADDRFATLFLGVYNEEDCLLTYVNAGHAPPLVFRPSTAHGAGSNLSPPQARSTAERPPQIPDSIEVLKLESGGLLLGVAPDFVYHESSLKLVAGDVFVCETDGITEAKDRTGKMYGSDRLPLIVASHHAESAERIHDRIFRDVESFVGDEPQADDMTLVVGTVSREPALSGFLPHLEILSEDPSEMESVDRESYWR